MKTISHLFIGLLLLTGCSHRPQVNPNEFLIEGYISNLADSSIIQLHKPDGSLLKVVTLETAINGHFTLRDTLSYRLVRLCGILEMSMLCSELSTTRRKIFRY